MDANLGEKSTESNLSIGFAFFWNFQVPKGENFSLSTDFRCFSPIVIFFFECTFEHFMRCSFKTGSRNPLRGVVFS